MYIIVNTTQKNPIFRQIVTQGQIPFFQSIIIASILVVLALWMYKFVNEHYHHPRQKQNYKIGRKVYDLNSQVQPIAKEIIKNKRFKDPRIKSSQIREMTNNNQSLTKHQGYEQPSQTQQSLLKKNQNSRYLPRAQQSKIDKKNQNSLNFIPPTQNYSDNMDEQKQVEQIARQSNETVDKKSNILKLFDQAKQKMSQTINFQHSSIRQSRVARQSKIKTQLKQISQYSMLRKEKQIYQQDQQNVNTDGPQFKEKSISKSSISIQDEQQNRKREEFHSLNNKKEQVSIHQRQQPKQIPSFSNFDNTQSRSQINLIDNHRLDQQNPQLKNQKQISNNHQKKKSNQQFPLIANKKLQSEVIKDIPNKSIFDFINKAEQKTPNMIPANLFNPSAIATSIQAASNVTPKLENQKSLFPLRDNNHMPSNERGQPNTTNTQKSESRRQKQKSIFNKKQAREVVSIQQGPSSSAELSSFEYLEKLIQFGKNAKIQCDITTKLNNLGGSRSTLNDLWAFAKNFIGTIKTNNSKEVNTFATKIWDSIVNTLIKNTNIKKGVQRMPPLDLTQQVQKNSINCYILIINLFRVMGKQKIWLIVVGKTLAMVDFIYKRKQLIRQFTSLELLKSGYVAKQGQIAPKYISRVDFLTYFLLGLCSFDPIEVFSEVNERTQENNNSAFEQLKNYNYKWCYRQFFCLIQQILANKTETYFKPILYMNIYSSIYLQVRRNKQNPTLFPQFVEIYKLIGAKSTNFMMNIKKNPQVNALSKQNQCQQGKFGFQFDGDEFLTSIDTLKNRLKLKEDELRYKLNEFQDKTSIFYYFKKSKA